MNKPVYGQGSHHPFPKKKGSECFPFVRTRPQPIRTASLIPFQLKIPCYEATPLYQILSPKIKELKALGMTNKEIATKLKINRKTVGKSLQSAYNK